MKPFDLVVGLKGAGKQATGIARRLYKSNIPKTFIVEIENPNIKH